MIIHSLTSKTKNITGFDRFSKFFVLGNNIDSYISIRREEFKNWEDFTQLPKCIGILNSQENGV